MNCVVREWPEIPWRRRIKLDFLLQLFLVMFSPQLYVIMKILTGSLAQRHANFTNAL